MKNFSRRIVSLAFAALALVGGAQAATSSSSRIEAVEKARAAGKPVLDKGMTAEEIVRLVGKPAEIAPMASSEGKAERWTYRRVADQKVTQTAATMRSTPMFVGFTSDGPTIADVGVPEYRIKREVTHQVTSLLIYEGRLASATQKLERSESYVD